MTAWIDSAVDALQRMHTRQTAGERVNDISADNSSDSASPASPEEPSLRQLREQVAALGSLQAKHAETINALIDQEVSLSLRSQSLDVECVRGESTDVTINVANSFGEAQKIFATVICRDASLLAGDILEVPSIAAGESSPVSLTLAVDPHVDYGEVLQFDIELRNSQEHLLRIHGKAQVVEFAPELPAGTKSFEVSPVAMLEQYARSLQQVTLTHPATAGYLYAALVAEGERYAATIEGAALKERVARSALAAQLSKVFHESTLGLLMGEHKAGALPSEYADTLFQLALRRNGGQRDA